MALERFTNPDVRYCSEPYYYAYYASYQSTLHPSSPSLPYATLQIDSPPRPPGFAVPQTLTKIQRKTPTAGHVNAPSAPCQCVVQVDIPTSDACQSRAPSPLQGAPPGSHCALSNKSASSSIISSIATENSPMTNMGSSCPPSVTYSYPYSPFPSSSTQWRTTPNNSRSPCIFSPRRISSSPWTCASRQSPLKRAAAKLVSRLSNMKWSRQPEKEHAAVKTPTTVKLDYHYTLDDELEDFGFSEKKGTTIKTEELVASFGAYRLRID